MEIVKKEISLNVGQPNNFEMICAMQGDNKSFEVTATLYDVNKLYKITTNTIRIKGLNALDENIYLNVDSHTDYTVTFTLTEQILTYDGLVRLVLVFNDGGKQLTTFPFVIKVINSPGNTDTSDAKAISALVEEAEKWANLSKSYAVGTNDTIRNGDSTDNSKYYCEQSKLASQNAKDASDKSEKASKDSQDTYDKIKKIADETKNITPSSLKKYKKIIVGDGIKSVFNLNHQLNTKDIIFEMNDGEETVLIDYIVVDENNTKITFEIPPTVNDMYYVTIFGVDDVGTNSGSGDDSGSGGENTENINIVSFETGTDDEISAMINAHYNGDINISDYWSVGDKRNITLSSMEGIDSEEKYETQTVELVIIGLDHDVLTTPINNKTKAAVTVHLKNCLNKRCCMDSTNAYLGGWEDCVGRTWCNNIFKNAIPSTIKGLIKNVNKNNYKVYNDTTISITSDSCFLLSETEIFGRNTYSVGDTEGTHYEYYKISSNRIKYVDGNNNIWWERSPFKNDERLLCVVNMNGTNGYDMPNSYGGFAPAFCM